MSVSEIPREWPEERDNLIVLTRWLADRGNTAKTVADAVATPAPFVVEYAIARAIVTHETTTGHQCMNHGNDYDWYCDPGDGKTVCQWEIHSWAHCSHVTVIDSEGTASRIRIPNPVN